MPAAVNLLSRSVSLYPTATNLRLELLPDLAFALLETDAAGVVASIARIPYDARGVAHEITAVGLPSEYSEYAEKLVLAT